MPVTISSRITANDGHRGEVSDVSHQSSRAAEMLLSAELTLLTFDDPPATFFSPDAVRPNGDVVDPIQCWVQSRTFMGLRIELLDGSNGIDGTLDEGRCDLELRNLERKTFERAEGRQSANFARQEGGIQLVGDYVDGD